MAVTAYGRPLERIRRMVPLPAPHEAVVRIHYCGVCRSDLKLARGQMAFSAEVALPHVLGHDAAGEIVAAGDEVTLPLGTRAVIYNYDNCRQCSNCRNGAENNCSALRYWFGFKHDGGFQQYVCVAAHRLLPVGDNLNLAEAATLSCGLATSYRAVVTQGGVRPGQRVAIAGCGGLGLHAVQLGAHLGAEVVAIDIADKARKAARRWGASASVESVDRAASVIAGDGGSEGFDVIVDFTGLARVHEQMMRAVRPGGRLVAVGYEAGASPALPLGDLVLGERTVTGSRYATRDEYARSLQLLERGVISPVIDRVHPVSDVNAVLDRLALESPVGRIVLQIDGI